MLQFTPLKNILNYIPASIRNEGSDLDLMSHALHAYRTMNIPEIFERKIALMEVKAHKVKIPSDVKDILLVTYQDTDPTKGDCKDLLQCVTLEEDEEGLVTDCTGCKVEPLDWATSTENVCRHSINYQLFLDSSYYNNNFMPLSYKGTRTGFCQNCFVDASCNYGFRVDMNGIMWVDFQEGFVCIDYITQPKDEEGNILIVDDQRLLMGLAYYAEAQHWRNRRGLKEQNAHNYYADAITRASTLIKAANGHIKLRNINSDDAKAYVMGTYKKAPMLRAPLKFYNRDYLSQRF